MPPRPVSLLVVAFWAATVGWLFYLDVWPQVRPGGPPPFTIDLADEATSVVNHRWTIVRRSPKGEEKMLGFAETWMTYLAEDDSFELHSKVKKLDLMSADFLAVEVADLNTTYHVTRDGRLLGARTGVDLAAKLRPGELTLYKLQAEIVGVVRDGELFAACRFESDGQLFEEQLPPVPAPRGNVLNPLQPVNRLRGLRAGQHWQLPLVDPLADAMRAGTKTLIARNLRGEGGALAQTLLDRAPQGPRVVAAEVGDKPVKCEYNNEQHDCWLIEYRGDGLSARTWVRVEDGLVLRQEATQQDDTLILHRIGAQTRVAP
jgi:hypothetical protein